MTNEMKKEALKARINLLESRGTHNAALVKKARRQLRALEKKDEN